MLRTVNFKLFSLISFCLFVLNGCSFLTTSEKPKLIIINVLDKHEYDDCHIKDSINIPFADFETKISSFNKNNHYVLYCADYACMSSAYCAQLLRNAGCKHVWEYAGGIVEWYQKGYPIQGPAQETYLKSENINYNDDEIVDTVISAEELLHKIKQFSLEQ